MKVAVISCRQRLEYIRARTLRQGFSSCRDVELIEVTNSKNGLMRYVDLIFQVLMTRIKQKPDVYVVTFRGYEILPFVVMIAGKKPVVFDEFINPVEWLVYEQHKLKPGSFSIRFLKKIYLIFVRRCQLILSDNIVHAEFSAKLNNVSLWKYKSIPVGTDEKLFSPATTKKLETAHKFKVFYYGDLMTPLHGLGYVLEAALRLRNAPNIEFLLVGGGEDARLEIENAKSHGAHVTYRPLIEFKKLPQVIRAQDLCLSGPFGNTVQSKLIIPAKAYQFMACKVATLIGKSRASDDFVDLKNALVVPQGNSRALAEKILWASKNKRKLGMVANNGYKTYIKQFSSMVIVKDCQVILDELSIN